MVQFLPIIGVTLILGLKGIPIFFIGNGMEIWASPLHDKFHDLQGLVIHDKCVNLQGLFIQSICDGSIGAFSEMPQVHIEANLNATPEITPPILQPHVQVSMMLHVRGDPIEFVSWHECVRMQLEHTSGINSCK